MKNQELLDRMPAILKTAAEEHIRDGYRIVGYDNEQLVLSKRVRLKGWKIVLAFFLGIYSLSPLLIYQDIIGAKCFIYLRINREAVDLSTG